MTRKLKKRLKRIIIGAAFFAAAVLIENFAPGLPWYVSVSYTHLDVYKRQRWRRFTATFIWTAGWNG